MLSVGKQGRRGFTLTELIVVLAIGAVLTALALPAVSSLGFNSRNEFKGAAREIYSMLNAARIYATTYNVKCGVVYVLDNYQPLDVNPNNDPGLRSPYLDSDPRPDYVGNVVRCLTAAAVMYELPASSREYRGDRGRPSDAPRNWAPVPGEEGIFKPILGNLVIPMQLDSRYDVVTQENFTYNSDLPRPDIANDSVSSLGMKVIYAYTDGFGPLSEERINNPGAPPNSDGAINLAVPEDPDNVETFIAHVFDSTGKLECSGNKQRFVFSVTLPPDSEINQRFDRDENADINDRKILTVPIEITKASGRVRIGTRT